ncbi:hypothetical protein CIPAW_16G109400 [Carya illinoinensis]|uniref:Uncharacterized protein n=1 Tax=Carya illinoinensis TaxID=32201 RepID=A0A8T1N2Y0_CARIL|nr:hypothetical protein CIPAW_16G109400 [Carya illinoinensis]
MIYSKLWAKKLFVKSQTKILENALGCGLMKMFVMYLNKIREQTKLKAY